VVAPGSLLLLQLLQLLLRLLLLPNVAVLVRCCNVLEPK
jgi:hypothetical protein